MWIPEVGFGNVSKMEPITRIENIPVSWDCKTFYLQCSELNKKDLTILSRTGNYIEAEHQNFLPQHPTYVATMSQLVRVLRTSDEDH